MTFGVSQRISLSTATVPERLKVVHINCMAHVHMHIEKRVPGNLVHRETLLCSLNLLKKIDEGNKVTRIPMTLWSHHHQYQMNTCVAHV